MTDDGGMRLPWRRERPIYEREVWMATATKYAGHLTETGSRCDLNTGQQRFCHWQATELPRGDIGVRCSIHPGGRYLDASARLDPQDFAPTRD